MPSLNEQALLATLRLSIFSPTKTDKSISQALVTDKHAKSGTLRAVKTLLSVEAIEPVRKIQNEIKAYHYDHTLPWGDDNARLLKSAFYLEYTDAMRNLIRKADDLADAFCKKYKSFVDQARQDLGTAFSDADYPPQATIRKKFAVKLAVGPVPDPNDFRVTLQKEALDQLQEDFGRQVEEAKANARNEVWKLISEPLARMAERLGDPEHAFKDSLVGNIAAMCELVPNINVTDDPEIEAIRVKIQRELAGKDPDVLRENPMARNVAARKAAEILNEMSGYMERES